METYVKTIVKPKPPKPPKLSSEERYRVFNDYLTFIQAGVIYRDRLDNGEELSIKVMDCTDKDRVYLRELADRVSITRFKNKIHYLERYVFSIPKKPKKKFPLALGPKQAKQLVTCVKDWMDINKLGPINLYTLFRILERKGSRKFRREIHPLLAAFEERFHKEIFGSWEEEWGNSEEPISALPPDS
jgi:hypothetical protein